MLFDLSHLQDKAKLKVRKRSDPIEQDVINNMVRYARKIIREFRAVKFTKNILSMFYQQHIVNQNMNQLFVHWISGLTNI